jgi:hypothetical protein
MSARGNPLIKRCRDNRVATHQESWISRETSGDDHASCDFRNDAVFDAEPGAVGVAVGASAALTRIKFVLFQKPKIALAPITKSQSQPIVATATAMKYAALIALFRTGPR